MTAKSDGTVRLTPATPKTKAAPIAAKPASAPAPKVVGAAAAMPAGEVVKKPEFIDRVIARTSVKKKDAKPAIEAALAELADILAAGGEVVLPPMGKIKAVKVKDLGEGAQMLTLKLRTMKDGAGMGAGGQNDFSADAGVADTSDDS